MWILLTLSLSARAGQPGVAWTSPTADPVGVDGLVVGDFDGLPPLDAAATVTALDRAWVEVYLRPEKRLVRVSSSAPGPLRLLTADVDGDGLDELIVGEPGYSAQIPPAAEGRTLVVLDVKALVDGDPYERKSTAISAAPGSNLGAGLAVADVNGDARVDLLVSGIGGVTPIDRSGDILAFPDLVTAAAYDAALAGRWRAAKGWLPQASRNGSSLAASGGILLGLGCAEGPLGSCDRLTLFQVLASSWPGSDATAEVPDTQRLNSDLSVTGREELIWWDDLDGDGAPDALLTGTTLHRVSPSSPPVITNAGLRVEPGGAATRRHPEGTRLLLADAGVVYEFEDPTAVSFDVAFANDQWSLTGAARLRTADDWDGDGCPDTLVSGLGGVGVIPGDCTVTVDTDPPLDTDPPVDTDAETDLDTDPAGEDTATPLPCEPSFGWSCRQAPLPTMLPALGVLWALTRGSRRRPPTGKRAS